MFEAYQNCNVTITPSAISVNGAAFAIDGEASEKVLALLDGTHAISWRPKNSERQKRRGYIEGTTDSHGFDDFNEIKPYVEFWIDAKAIRDAELAVKKAEEDAKREEEQTVQAENDEAQAKHAQALKDRAEKRKPMITALGILTRSDHEIIKAMEAKLVADGLITKELADKRQGARDIVKAERSKLED